MLLRVCRQIATYVWGHRQRDFSWSDRPWTWRKYFLPKRQLTIQPTRSNATIYLHLLSPDSSTLTSSVHSTFSACLSVCYVPHTAGQLPRVKLSFLSEQRGSSQTRAPSLTTAWVATAGFHRMSSSRYITPLIFYSRAGEPFSGLVSKMSKNFE